jgi:uncharacterized membrane protein
MRDEKRKNKNRFDRGYNRGNYSEQNRVTVFPSPSLLESYEEISPGIGNKLAEILKFEQKHRHDWENKYLSSMTYTSRIGQLFGFALCILIIYTTVVLAMDKNVYLAAVVCLSGFGFLVCATLASLRSRRHMRRPHRSYGKYNNRRS